MAFFMANDHHWPVAQTSQSTHDRVVIGKVTVARQGSVFLKQLLNVIFAMRPVGVAGHLAFAPWCQLGVKLFQHVTGFFVQSFGLRLNIHILIVTAHRAQLFSLAFNFC